MTSFELGCRDSFEGNDKLSLRPIQVEMLEGHPCEIIQEAHGKYGWGSQNQGQTGSHRSKLQLKPWIWMK